MLQQTTVAAVKDYFLKFTKTWPTVVNLAAADDAEIMAAWAGLGYYARARNLLKCARTIVEDYDGRFPKTRAELEKLPGIGPYTSAAISAIAYDLPETVVDGNVERVMSRLYAVEKPLPMSKQHLTELAETLTPVTRAGDYAQAVMDLGATICSPKNPACGICPWRDPCEARSRGIAAELPRKMPKAVKPTRKGFAYVVRRDDGAWLLETRPENGLLGGMLGWPGSEWSDDPVKVPPVETEWTENTAEVRHTFTHFHLRLTVFTAKVNKAGNPESGRFIAHEDFKPSHLPTVMRKVFDVAKHDLASD